MGWSRLDKKSLISARISGEVVRLITKWNLTMQITPDKMEATLDGKKVMTYKAKPMSIDELEKFQIELESIIETIL